MKVAIVGSRNLNISEIQEYLPKNISEIISGGAKGVDTCARRFAQNNNIKLTEYLPDYKTYGRAAPLKRNLTIIENSDMVIAFWDGISKGTKYVIDQCYKKNIFIKVYLVTATGISLFPSDLSASDL